jgi:hypothetical protein
MTKKPSAGGGNATGTHDRLVSALLLMVVDEPAGYRPGGRARKRADVVR